MLRSRARLKASVQLSLRIQRSVQVEIVAIPRRTSCVRCKRGGNLSPSVPLDSQKATDIAILAKSLLGGSPTVALFFYVGVNDSNDFVSKVCEIQRNGFACEFTKEQ